MATRSDFFSQLVIDGAGVFNGRTTDEYLLEATYEYVVDQDTELAFTMYDPNYAYLTSFNSDRGPIGKRAVYGGLQYEVASFTCSPGPSGQGEVAYKLRPLGVQKLHKITGALNRTNISASQYVTDAAKRQGMQVWVQNSPNKPSIERDTKEGLGSGDERSEWTTIKGLAGEEGYLAFERDNTLYFATPRYLFDKMPNVNVYWLGPQASIPDRHTTMLSAPQVDFGSQNTEDEISFSLPITAAGRIYPGYTITLFNVPKIAKKLLVTSVSYPVAGQGDVQVKAKMPWTIEKVERAKPQPKLDLNYKFGGGGGVGMGATGKGKRFYASEICMAAKERNLGRDGARNGIATALVETNLTMYANRAVPASLNYPHDAVGSDHDSVGLFQQRQAGWGTLAQRMNPRASAGLFFNKMMTFNWRAMDPGAACQRVQVSAYPGRYSQRMGEANQWVAAVY